MPRPVPAGERDYLDAEDVEGITHAAAGAGPAPAARPPTVAQIVAMCRRLNVPVML